MVLLVLLLVFVGVDVAVVAVAFGVDVVLAVVDRSSYPTASDMPSVC